MSLFTSTSVYLILLGIMKTPLNVENLIIALAPCSRRMYKCSHMNLHTSSLVPEARESQKDSLPGLGSHLLQEQCLILISNSAFLHYLFDPLEITQ